METYNKIIVFPENIKQIISELLKKYGMEETREETITRLKQKKILKAVFLAKVAKDCFQKKSPADNINLIKENLETSEDTAKKIFADIKKGIVPLIKEIGRSVPQEEISTTTRSEINSPQKNTGYAKDDTADMEAKTKTIPPVKREKLYKDVASQQKPVSENQSRESDKYREPIG